MANEPQRDIEHDLRAYQQRRDGQLGAPVELHPATRRLLQGEVARTAGRPLLTSEEAAKNFVRSFVMSHQQPGFFARHRPQILWGGGMFACLAVVLLLLRNDPQRVARQSTFPDALPAPPPVASPQPAPSPTVAAVGRPLAENESLARARRFAPAADEAKDAILLPVAPAGSPAPGSFRGITVASGPMPAAQREAGASRAGSVAPTPAPTVAFERGTVAAAPAGGMGVTKSEAAVSRQLLMRDLDRKAEAKLAEQAAAGEVAQLDKALKAASGAARPAAPTAKAPAEEVKLKLADDLKRAQVVNLGGVAGATAPAGPAATASSALAATPAPRMLQDAVAGGGSAAITQRFQQQDTRANLRQNFNSPPVPQVMQDFAFERSGDRVRIVDADGSTYEGAVLSGLVEEARRAKLGVGLAAVKERKTALDQEAQTAVPATGAQVSYRFYATGLNRKLNQSVEFRGEWLPLAPVSQAGATPALQTASFGATRLEKVEAAKKDAPATNAASLAPLRTDAYALPPTQPQPSPSGRISGRAVVGGRNEFEVNAVPK